MCLQIKLVSISCDEVLTGQSQQKRHHYDESGGAGAGHDLRRDEMRR